jgi:glycosyltransferase involved in cell wall biosynthesis
LRALERCSYAVADVVIATNESYRKVALERGHMRGDRVFVVRNGPPLSFQSADPDPELAARAEHIIGYIGTMGPQDGVDYWLRAIREMVFTLGRRDFLAVIIGTGDAATGLHALAGELQIEPYVWFTGRIPDDEARAYLSTADVCVHPDPLNPLNDRSTMNKMMEYMALGKPTVAFDLVEARFSAQDSALYAKPNDELEFARHVSWLLDHPAERERMGRIGRERVTGAMAWEYSVPELLRAYSEGLGFAAGTTGGHAGSAAGQITPQE